MTFRRDINPLTKICNVLSIFLLKPLVNVRYVISAGLFRQSLVWVGAPNTESKNLICVDGQRRVFPALVHIISSSIEPHFLATSISVSFEI